MTTTSRDDRRVPIRTKVEHLPLAERVDRGKAARAEVPRAAHADLPLGADRPDPIALLEGQAATRVPELVPIRYGRMLVSPFTFYRGAALIMASDLSQTPTTSLRAQLCGDAHLSNFGVFGSPERRLVFDINDFDETLPGPFEWDLKRLAASLEVAGRDRGYSDAEREGIVLTCVRTYREAMARLRGRDQPRGVLRELRRGGDVRPLPGHGPGEGLQARREGPGQGAHQGQHAGARRSSPTWWTARRASRPTRR